MQKLYLHVFSKEVLYYIIVNVGVCHPNKGQCSPVQLAPMERYQGGGGGGGGLHVHVVLLALLETLRLSVRYSVETDPDGGAYIYHNSLYTLVLRVPLPHLISPPPTPTTCFFLEGNTPVVCRSIH